MNIHIIYFTREAEKLAFSLRSGLEEKNDALTIASGGRNTSLPYIPVSLWTTGHFRSGEALVFIGAAGIATRSIARHIRDKMTDPAVIVVDEQGKYAIPILSGHIGEANRLSREIAQITGGTAVLTTASDVRGLFAIDVFAKDNHLTISDKEAAKRYAAAMLDYGSCVVVVPGEMRDVIRFQDEPPREVGIESTIPDANADAVCLITPYDRADQFLRLIPRSLIVGIGCRKGISEEALLAFVEEALQKEHLSPHAIDQFVSIDLKKEEPALISLSRHYDRPFVTYDRDRLREQVMPDGTFFGSAFVEETVGVDNVCERATAAAGAKRFLLRKWAREGMTIAIGIKETSLYFQSDPESLE